MNDTVKKMMGGAALAAVIGKMRRGQKMAEQRALVKARRQLMRTAERVQHDLARTAARTPGGFGRSSQRGLHWSLASRLQQEAQRLLGRKKHTARLGLGLGKLEVSKWRGLSAVSGGRIRPGKRTALMALDMGKLGLMGKLGFMGKLGMMGKSGMMARSKRSRAGNNWLLALGLALGLAAATMLVSGLQRGRRDGRGTKVLTGTRDSLAGVAQDVAARARATTAQAGRAAGGAAQTATRTGDAEPAAGAAAVEMLRASQAAVQGQPVTAAEEGQAAGTTPQEIAPQDWKTFCADFSRENRSWSATLDVQNAEGQRHAVAQDLPLMGVTYEVGEGIQVMLGDQPDTTYEHNVTDPAHLRVLVDANGIQDGVQIQSTDGAVTTLRIRPPRQ